MPSEFTKSAIRKIPFIGRVYRQRDSARRRLAEVQRRLDAVMDGGAGALSSQEDLAQADEDRKFSEIWERCAPYTMTSFERGLALYRAVRYLAKSGLAGDFVECGVWRGGSTMIAMMTLRQLKASPRRFYLFDTFAGMSEPCEHDADLAGTPAKRLLEAEANRRESAPVWAYAGLDEVRSNLGRTGYDLSQVVFVEGDVCETLRRTVPGAIALLRLDTDFYESTRAELEVLYPRLLRHGVLIVDDFGHWRGARRAVEEYFSDPVRASVPRFFHRIDYTGRLLVRPDPSPLESTPRYDYVPPGLEEAGLLPLFPTLTVSDPFRIPWMHLRPYVPHHWRTDSRNVHQGPTGVLSVEEASLLFNNARVFRGRRGLEIGCHLGWSAAHLLAAGLDLDIVDPALGRADQEAAVRSSLDRVRTEGSYQLWAAYSPGALPKVRRARPEPWSFVFVDGEHEGESPRLDAEAVAGRCAEDACVMFHDMKSPFVAQGLQAMKEHGWNVGLYNTMQIMGIAWRGAVEPVRHVGDPNVPAADDPWLEGFPLLSVVGG